MDANSRESLDATNTGIKKVSEKIGRELKGKLEEAGHKIEDFAIEESHRGDVMSIFMVSDCFYS